MRRLLTILVALAGCSGGSGGEDPNTITTCGSDTGIDAGKQVYLACRQACGGAEVLTGPACSADIVFVENGSDAPTDCDQTLTFEGHRGCCLLGVGGPGDTVIRFAECQ
jgi:hypothetical protein